MIFRTLQYQPNFNVFEMEKATFGKQKQDASGSGTQISITLIQRKVLEKSDNQR